MDFGRTLWEEGGRRYRRILAVKVGDWILVNGIVVGKVRSRDVVMVEEGGRIVEIRGAEVKEHGLEKVVGVSLAEVKIDTISLLRGPVSRRRRVETKKSNRIAFINHAGYDVYNYVEKQIAGAVTVGDDTTAIVGDILSRYRVPIVGLVDGDADGLLGDADYADGSVVLWVTKDDSFGKLVFDEIFKRETCIHGRMGEVRDTIIDLAKKRGYLKKLHTPQRAPSDR